jgi:hypothetical protein
VATYETRMITAKRPIQQEERSLHSWLIMVLETPDAGSKPAKLNKCNKHQGPRLQTCGYRFLWLLSGAKYH